MPGIFRILVCVIGAMVVSIASAQDEFIGDSIFFRIEQLQTHGYISIRGSTIASVALLPEFYERRNYTPAWTNPKSVQDLVAAIQDSGNDGLNPKDYHYSAVTELIKKIAANPHPLFQADLDILLTDSLIRLAYHLMFGKVDNESLDTNWNLVQNLNMPDPVGVLQAAIDSNELKLKIDALRPQNKLYAEFQNALARYRLTLEKGGWPKIPSTGVSLKKGEHNERVPVLRERLHLEGYLAAIPPDPLLFDDELEQAVMRYQLHHYLEPDGAVGSQTLKSLNISVRERINQIRVNLERARWVLPLLKDRYVLVDIAGFRAMYAENGEIIWSSRVQVGNQYRETPVFKDTITYVEFNPTWTIPPSVLYEDILPKVKKNPNYLNARNIRVLDRNGNRVDEHKLKWAAFSRRNFPYILRQDPGPNNALGLVKIMFPNKHFVYLHDTPSKDLFSKSQRSFSSGCVRVEKAFELTQLLLNDPVNWNQDSIHAAIDSKRTRKVFLTERVPIYLLYWTVQVDEDGTVAFKQDIYGRDQAVERALNAEFSFRKRPLLKPR